MRRPPATIICDAAMARAPSDSAPAGDWHDTTCHHRYYGSSATNGGERIVENRRGMRRRLIGLFGF